MVATSAKAVAADATELPATAHALSDARVLKSEQSALKLPALALGLVAHESTFKRARPFEAGADTKHPPVSTHADWVRLVLKRADMAPAEYTTSALTTNKAYDSPLPANHVGTEEISVASELAESFFALACVPATAIPASGSAPTSAMPAAENSPPLSNVDPDLGRSSSLELASLTEHGASLPVREAVRPETPRARHGETFLMSPKPACLETWVETASHERARPSEGASSPEATIAEAEAALISAAASSPDEAKPTGLALQSDGELTTCTPKPPTLQAPMLVHRGDGGSGLAVHFNACYELQRELGKGAQAVVRLAAHRGASGAPHLFAIKSVQASSTSAQQFVDDEVEALRRLRGHPHVVTLFEVFDERCPTVGAVALAQPAPTAQEMPRVHLVLEYLAGGELFDRLIERGAYSEADARASLYEAVAAIAAMHAAGIMHRDLKPCVCVAPQRCSGRFPFLLRAAAWRIER